MNRIEQSHIIAGDSIDDIETGRQTEHSKLGAGIELIALQTDTCQCIAALHEPGHRSIIRPRIQIAGPARRSIRPGPDITIVIIGDGKLQIVFIPDRKSTRLNTSHVKNSYAVICLKKKKLK